MRWRSLIGILVLVAGLAFYGLAVTALAAHLLPGDGIAEIGFYAVAGIVWILPAARLTRWMVGSSALTPRD
ncbi:MAG TPA: DUF2842 domain-containing protein [Stellaceae bacterium]|nr:DUF2842 domain-containing protein [Stellaceae bacterium]